MISNFIEMCFLQLLRENRCISGIDRDTAFFAVTRLRRRRKKKLCNILVGTEQSVCGIIMTRTVFATLTIEKSEK